MITAKQIDKTIKYIEELEAENKRLLADVAFFSSLRNSIIEKCARVADKYFVEGVDIAAEIRALKNKK